MRASILAIGDEIVGGTTLDTNSPFLSLALRECGVEVVAIFSVPDEETAIARAVERALEEAELVVSTGGLGPTADDLTTACVARLAGLPLELDEPSLARIEERFRSRGIELTPNNRKQALFPAGSEIVPNPIGTAPGFICPVEVGGSTRHLVSLPGVPHEMKRMVEETLIPWVRGRSPGVVFASRVFSTYGLAESCTGGLIGHRITDVPGSSAYFRLGIVAYANEAKQALLDVPAETLERFGAVSVETAESMAEGVRRRAGSDLGVATTGIAGPGGGTAEKPVGTVCVAVAWEGGAWSRRYDLGERSRDWVKQMTAQIALDRVRRHLLRLPD